MTETQWQQKRNAVELILHFMGILNTDNSYLTMKYFWNAMNDQGLPSCPFAPIL